MTYQLIYDLSREDYDAVDEELEDSLDRLGKMRAASGRKALAFLGPTGQPPTLRFGIDDDAGRAVIQWLPTGEYGLVPGVTPTGDRLTFDVAAGREVVGFAERVACASPDAVREAIRGYVRTGERPRNVTWQLR